MAWRPPRRGAILAALLAILFAVPKGRVLAVRRADIEAQDAVTRLSLAGDWFAAREPIGDWLRDRLQEMSPDAGLPVFQGRARRAHKPSRASAVDVREGLSVASRGRGAVRRYGRGARVPPSRVLPERRRIARPS